MPHKLLIVEKRMETPPLRNVYSESKLQIIFLELFSYIIVDTEQILHDSY